MECQQTPTRNSPWKFVTMAPILDEGVSNLSFCLEGVEQVVPYVLGSYLVFKRELWSK
jgi:hypothetical protein